MDKLKNIGLIFDPREAPKIIFLKSKLLLLTGTLSFRLLRYKKTKANASIVKPYSFSFEFNMSCETQLNTFDRPVKIGPTVKYWSCFSLHSLISFAKSGSDG